MNPATDLSVPNFFAVVFIATTGESSVSIASITALIVEDTIARSVPRMMDCRVVVGVEIPAPRACRVAIHVAKRLVMIAALVAIAATVMATTPMLGMC
mmetsp:Transcript_48638/g.72610  ORF Transcript_48638/g.72610 Transcript_48638/m.72610 type:complete len:98 (-) Transcript_48638:228-521(-)